MTSTCMKVAVVFIVLVALTGGIVGLCIYLHDKDSKKEVYEHAEPKPVRSGGQKYPCTGFRVGDEVQTTKDFGKQPEGTSKEKRLHFLSKPEETPKQKKLYFLRSAHFYIAELDHEFGQIITVARYDKKGQRQIYKFTLKEFHECFYSNDSK